MDRSPTEDKRARWVAVRFVLTIGILSFFADFTYEGSRSIIGPFLGTLGATGTVVGIVTGFGELLGYGLRLVSGRWADTSGKYWPITIFGYVVQMLSVPALAFADNWPTAAALIILERVGKAIRNPPRDVMLSHAGKQAGGYGWVFGLHEALDQFGAMFGPLLVAAVLAHRGSYHQAFALLLVPAVINLSLVLTARLLYPRPQDMEPGTRPIDSHGLPRIFWIYLDRRGAGRRRVRRLSADRIPFPAGRHGAGRLGRDFLFDRHGGQRHWLTGARTPVRSLGFSRAHRSHHCRRWLCSARVPWRVLGSNGGCGGLGNRHGCA